MKRACVATVGPACNRPDVLRKMVAAGVNCFRVNLSHETDPNQVISDLSTLRADILVDLQGPKFRVGKSKQVVLETKQEFVIDNRVDEPGNTVRCGLKNAS